MADGNVLERVLKDVGDVQGRLFDHRPFTQGEIRFLVKEFELERLEELSMMAEDDLVQVLKYYNHHVVFLKEKRKEREVQQMFEMLEMVTDIKETQIEKAVKLGDMHLCNLTANFEVALRMCNNIVEREYTDKKKRYLDERRVMRKKEWVTFVDDIQNKNTAVNQTFADKEEQLKNYYNKLEEAMNISPSHSPNIS